MTTQYKVSLTRSAAKELEKAPNNMKGRLKATVESLGREPRPPGCKKMSGFGDRWRVREGDWRIVYTIYDRELSVDVIRVATRDEVYD